MSTDNPISLYLFDCKKAEQKLLSSVLIRKAKVSKLFPNAIYVDYEVRKPVAIIADYQNTGIDQEGYLVPLYPFFTPKEIPEIYLGLLPFGAEEDQSGRIGGQWFVPIRNRYSALAFEVLHSLEASSWRDNFRVKRIDVSNAFAPSLGQREVVVFTEEEMFIDEKSYSFPKILRLATKDFTQQLGNFSFLRKNIEEDYRKLLAQNPPSSQRFAPRIIDLRIPQLAFVENH